MCSYRLMQFTMLTTEYKRSKQTKKAEIYIFFLRFDVGLNILHSIFMIDLFKQEKKLNSFYVFQKQYLQSLLFTLSAGITLLQIYVCSYVQRFKLNSVIIT